MPAKKTTDLSTFVFVCGTMLQMRLNSLMSYESRVQQISADASEEISRLDLAKVLEEKLQRLNHLWADIARKLGRYCYIEIFANILLLYLMRDVNLD